MRVRLVLAALALAGFLLPASEAFAYCNPHSNGGKSCLAQCMTNPPCASANDKACKQLGETTMDGDKQNLIACMDDGTGTNSNIWKPMTSGSGTGYPKNHPEISCNANWSGIAMNTIHEHSAGFGFGARLPLDTDGTRLPSDIPYHADAPSPTDYKPTTCHARTDADGTPWLKFNSWVVGNGTYSTLFYPSTTGWMRNTEHFGDCHLSPIALQCENPYSRIPATFTPTIVPWTFH